MATTRSGAHTVYLPGWPPGSSLTPLVPVRTPPDELILSCFVKREQRRRAELYVAIQTVKSPRDTVGAAAAAGETDPANGYLSKGHPAADPGSIAAVTMNHDVHLYHSSLSMVTAQPLRSMQSPCRQGNRALYNDSVYLLTVAAPMNVRVRLSRTPLVVPLLLPRHSHWLVSPTLACSFVALAAVPALLAGIVVAISRRWR